MRHDGSGSSETWQTYSYNSLIPSISTIRMSGQSGRDSTSCSFALPPDWRVQTKHARCPLCSTAWGRKQRMCLPQRKYPTKNGNGMMSKFDRFFKVQKKLIFERARFNQRNQSENESVEQYITAPYHLIETCETKETRRCTVGLLWAYATQRCHRSCRWTPSLLWRRQWRPSDRAL